MLKLRMSYIDDCFGLCGGGILPARFQLDSHSMGSRNFHVFERALNINNAGPVADLVAEANAGEPRETVDINSFELLRVLGTGGTED